MTRSVDPSNKNHHLFENLVIDSLKAYIAPIPIQEKPGILIEVFLQTLLSLECTLLCTTVTSRIEIYLPFVNQSRKIFAKYRTLNEENVESFHSSCEVIRISNDMVPCTDEVALEVGKEKKFDQLLQRKNCDNLNVFQQGFLKGMQKKKNLLVYKMSWARQKGNLLR